MLEQSFLAPIIAALAIMLASLVGLLTLRKGLNSWIQRNLTYCVSFSAGVFIIIAFNAAREALELSSSSAVAIISIFSGIIIFHLIERLMPETHHHHASNDPSDTHTAVGAKKILLGDALHNFGDGILLVPAFFVDLRLGIITSVGIFVHELIQEMSEFFVLQASGYTFKQAIQKNMAVSATVLGGVIVGLLVGTIPYFIGPLLGIAAGAFMYVVLHDLVPRSLRSVQEHGGYIAYVFAVLLGIFAMVGLSALGMSA